MADMRETETMLILLALFASLVAGELRFVHLLIRHGQRAPIELPYPSDAYGVEEWGGMWGDATQVGKDESIALGRYYRDVYGPFVGDLNLANIGFRSNNIHRIITAAQLFARGFFAELKYPVPVFTSGSPDTLLDPHGLFLLNSCPRWQNIVDSDAFDSVLNRNYSSFIEEMSTINGLADFGVKYANNLRDVEREISHGLVSRQPEWVWKKRAEYGNKTAIEIGRHWRRLRIINKFDTMQKARFGAGRLLSDILTRMRQIAKGVQPNDQPRKMLVYSTHETTLLPLMVLLGQSADHIPPTSSSLSVELHEERGDWTVEVHYRNASQSHRLAVPCERTVGESCPLDTLIRTLDGQSIESEERFYQLCGADYCRRTNFIKYI